MAESISNALLSTIDYGVQQRLSSAKFDKTIVCTVTNVTDKWVTLSNGGSTFTIKLKNNFSIKRGDKVHLKYPSNNKDNKYLEEDISGGGSSSSSSTTSAVLSVNGHTGNVVIAISDIEGLSDALNAKSGNIPISWGEKPSDDIKGTWGVGEPSSAVEGAYWFDITNRKI